MTWQQQHCKMTGNWHKKKKKHYLTAQCGTVGAFLALSHHTTNMIWSWNMQVGWGGIRNRKKVLLILLMLATWFNWQVLVTWTFHLISSPTHFMSLCSLPNKLFVHLTIFISQKRPEAQILSDPQLKAPLHTPEFHKQYGVRFASQVKESIKVISLDHDKLYQKLYYKTTPKSWEKKITSAELRVSLWQTSSHDLFLMKRWLSWQVHSWEGDHTWKASSHVQVLGLPTYT